MKDKWVNVLLVEDDDVDIECVKRAFQDLNIGNPLTTVSDGVMALEVLRGENGRLRLPRPNLILLDLAMPRMNGIEFLQEVRKDPKLNDLIVFVLTTSSSEEDKSDAYHLNVAGYIVKPEIRLGLEKAVRLLDQYWNIIEFPS